MPNFNSRITLLFILIASHLSWVASEKESHLMNIIPSNAHISLFIGETNGVLARKLWSYPPEMYIPPYSIFSLWGLPCTTNLSKQYTSESTCLQVATDIYSIEYLGNLLPRARANKHFWLSFLLRTKTSLEFSSTIDFWLLVDGNYWN